MAIKNYFWEKLNPTDYHLFEAETVFYYTRLGQCIVPWDSNS